MRYQVKSWPAYDAGLKRHGSLMLWVTPEAMAGWQAAHRFTPGGQPCYSDLAIEPGLRLRLAFRLPEGPVHLLIDSTGLKVYGVGEWLQEKHGAKARRTWRWMPTPG